MPYEGGGPSSPGSMKHDDLKPAAASGGGVAGAMSSGRQAARRLTPRQLMLGLYVLGLHVLLIVNQHCFVAS